MNQTPLLRTLLDTRSPFPGNFASSCLKRSALLLLLSLSSLSAVTVSPLLSRGYTVLPPPQKVNLGPEDFEFTADWRLELGQNIAAGDTGVQDLMAELAERFQLQLATGTSTSHAIRLAIQANAVTPGKTTDRNLSAVAEQAYRLELTAARITITGNSETGLFYGIQTLIQLMKRQDGRFLLPQALIEDWPDLELRTIYWDDAHHLEKLDVLEAAMRQAAFYKINGFALKLEGHFQFEHAPAIVEPYALSRAELQRLTDYGLRHHIQLIPYLDGPAHDAFILKHPEYAALREYPDNNYEFCSTNPRTYELLDGMFDDLLAANRGGKYFVLSTDEPYYVGLANNAQCKEAARAQQLGSVGKMLGEFVTKTADYLHTRDRTVIFWGEYPMKPDDIGALPSYLINGEVYGPQFDPIFQAHGIRQMIYTYTEGEEQLFPQYYVLPSVDRLHSAPSRTGRVQEMIDSITQSSLASLSSTRPDAARPHQSDLMGVFIAGWGDPGLHPETFWLGYATGPAAAWNRAATKSQELQSAFYTLFYGPDARNMGSLYQLMSEGAQAWEDTWDTGPSSARKPIWGNSYAIFDPPHPARDQYIPMLPVPSPELLRIGTDWQSENQKRLDAAGKALAKNDELLDLLHANIGRVAFNRYNLEVYLSLAGLYRQNLLMLEDLGRISESLKEAEVAAGRAEHAKALESLDHALETAQQIRISRNDALRDATETWYKSWLPRVPSANGRVFLDEVDDVKDHQPLRTVDMSYLVYRELIYPLGEWAQSVVAVRNRYAAAHKLATRELVFNWKDTN